MPSGAKITQAGSITHGHAVMWTIDGVAQDAGPATAGNLTGLGITSGSGVALGINSGTVAEPYTQFAIVMAEDLVQLVVQNFGTTATATFEFVINGSTYSIGAGGGDVLGPGSSVNGHAVIFNGTSGDLIADAGAPPVLATNASLEAALLALLNSLPTAPQVTPGFWNNAGVVTYS